LPSLAPGWLFRLNDQGLNRGFTGIDDDVRIDAFTDSGTAGRKTDFGRAAHVSDRRTSTRQREPEVWWVVVTLVADTRRRLPV